MHPSVVLALLCARGARCPAGFQYRKGDGRLPAGLPGQDVRCGRADIGAVQVSPNTGGEFCDHVLAQTRVRAARARLGALEAGRNTFGQTVFAQDSVSLWGWALNMALMSWLMLRLLSLGEGRPGRSRPSPSP